MEKGNLHKNIMAFFSITKDIYHELSEYAFFNLFFITFLDHSCRMSLEYYVMLCKKFDNGSFQFEILSVPL